MVVLTKTLLEKELKYVRRYLLSKFIDSVRLHVKGGSGGTGTPKYGGTGGQGGCVYCVGDETANLKTLMTSYRGRTVAAGNGEDSRKAKILGNPGSDVVLKVPLGITIYNEEGKILGSIDKEEDSVIVARGGPGGSAQNSFLGHYGQKHHIRLDLKLIADIGLVGFPNAGKSSLLKAISRAKPRIASYPFTTIKPNKAIIQYKDMRQISIADLPGLIEGAHINVGLGHKFLRHVERTKLLLFIADVQGFRLSPKHQFRSCLETVLLLNKELELYDDELLQKPAVLAINKMDLNGSKSTFENVLKSLQNIDEIIDTIPKEIRPNNLVKFQDIVGISALNDPESISKLKEILRKRLDEFAEETDLDIKNASDVLKISRATVKEKRAIIT